MNKIFCFLIGILLPATVYTKDPQIVKDINPGTGNSSPNYLTQINETLYFTANDGIHGIELWKTTADSAVMVKDIDTSGNANPSNLTQINETLYFTANDGIHGIELWKTTADSAVMVKDIDTSGSTNPSNLVQMNGVLYFSATDGIHGLELWKIEADSAVMIKDIDTNGSASPSNLTPMNGLLYFSAYDNTHGTELWKTNGTEEGTFIVKDINTGGSAGPLNFTPMNGLLYFSAYDDTHGTELWKTDGTEEGTLMTHDLYPGLASSAPQYLVNVNGILYFNAYDDTHGTELRMLVDNAITLVKEINSNGDATPSELTHVNGVLYFRANDGIRGEELWKSDGTEEGTVIVQDINSNNHSSPINLTPVDNILYFSANDGINGIELWKSDGTTEGTVIVKNINSGINSASPTRLTQVNDILYFCANDGTKGTELWKYMNTPPLIHVPVYTLTPQNTALDSISFTISDADTTADSLEITIKSIDTNLISNDSMTLGKIDSTNRFLTVKPMNNQWGLANIIISVNDGVLFTRDTFLVTINNTPTDINLSANSILENTGIGTQVTILSSTDINSGDSHTYTLISGNGDTDNSAFISSNDTLKTNAVFNYETDSTLSIRIQTTDSLKQTHQKAFTIYVQNTNDTPTDIILSTLNTTENLPKNSFIATLTTTDEDINDIYRYTFISGNGDTDNNAFTLSGDTLKTNTVFNYETDSTYSIRIQTTDSHNSNFEKLFIIHINNLNEPPTLTAVEPQYTDEDTPITIPITLGDPETPLENFTITVASDNPTLIPEANITIEGTDVHHNLIVTPLPNQNGLATLTLTVTDTENLSTNKSFIITVKAVNDSLSTPTQSFVPSVDPSIPLVFPDTDSPDTVDISDSLNLPITSFILNSYTQSKSHIEFVNNRTPLSIFIPQFTSQLIILDATGMELMRFSVKPDQKFSIPIEQLPTGKFFIKF